MPQKLIDMTGERYGRLVVIRREGSTNQNKPLWLCKCDCGNFTHVTRKRLREGSTTSCGCYRKELSKEMHSTHNMRKTRLYRIWSGIKDRCLNPRSKYWERYGGRGIDIASEWKNSFEAFYAWAISNGYNENLTIDRIDNNKGYKPDNCRWVTYEVQENNRRDNVLFRIDGEIITLAQLSKMTGLTRAIAEKTYKEDKIYGDK